MKEAVNIPVPAPVAENAMKELPLDDDVFSDEETKANTAAAVCPSSNKKYIYAAAAGAVMGAVVGLRLVQLSDKISEAMIV